MTRCVAGLSDAVGHKRALMKVGFYEDYSVKRRYSRRHLRMTSDRSAFAVRLRS